MNRYAGNTTVSVESSQREVQSILRKYGADRFGVMEDRDKAHLMFSIRGIAIQITISLPSKGDFELTEKGRSRKNLNQTRPMSRRYVKGGVRLF